jgi:hypothetical protein
MHENIQRKEYSTSEKEYKVLALLLSTRAASKLWTAV